MAIVPQANSNGINDNLELKDEVNNQKQIVDSNVFVASKKDPDLRARAADLSRDTNIPVEFVEGNFDQLKSKIERDKFNYLNLRQKNPDLATWLEDSNNAIYGKDDMDVLEKIDTKARKYPPYNDKDSLINIYKDRIHGGYKNLELAKTLFESVNLGGTPEEKADAIGQILAEMDEVVSDDSAKIREFDEMFSKEFQDVRIAGEQFLKLSEIKEKKGTFQALVAAGKAGTSTVGELVDAIDKTFVRNPGQALGHQLEQLPNLVVPFGSAIAGFGVGAGLGYLKGGKIGSAIGGSIGSTIGFFAGTTASEAANFIEESFSNRKIDIRKRDQLVRALSDKKIMAEIRAEALKKGISQASIQAVTGRISRLFAGPAKSIAGKVAKSTVGLGVETIGEGVEEIGARYAVKDITADDVDQMIQEMAGSLGHSIGQFGASTVLRAGESVADKVSPPPPKSDTEQKSEPSPDEGPGGVSDAGIEVDPVKEVRDFVGDVKETIQSQSDFKDLIELVDLAEESKTKKRSPESFKEVVKGKEVFFTAADWDEFWITKGESIIEKVESLVVGGMDAYTEAHTTGGTFAVNLGEYLSNKDLDETRRELFNIIRTHPESKSYAETVNFTQSINQEMERITKDAEKNLAEEDKFIESNNRISKAVRKQLIRTGRSEDEAVFLESFFRVLGIKEGKDPEEFYKRYGLDIAKIDESVLDDRLQEVFDRHRGELSQGATVQDIEQNNAEVMREMVNQGEPGSQVDRSQSTFPKFFQDVQFQDKQGKFKGITKKFALNVIDKVISGKKLTEKQQVAFDTMKEGFDKFVSDNLERGSTSKEDAGVPSFGKPQKIKDLVESGETIIYQGVRATNIDGKQGLSEFWTTDLSMAKFYGDREGPGAKIKISKLSNVDASYRNLQLDQLLDQTGNIFSKEEIEEVKKKSLADVLKDNDGVLEIPPKNIEVITEIDIESLPDDVVGNGAGSGTFKGSKMEAAILDTTIQTSSKKSRVLGAINRIKDTFGKDGKSPFSLLLFRGADKSTFFHENGHYFLEVLGHLSSQEDTSQGLKDDYAKILKWLGSEDGVITSDMHEKWARGFETYILEGKAPSRSLKRSFQKFKQWLVRIYIDKSHLRAELTDDVRGVMDRMLATEVEISHVDNKYKSPLYSAPEALGMTGRFAEDYIETVGDHRAEASAQLQVELEKSEARLQRRKAKAARRVIKERVSSEVNQERIYRLLSYLRRGKLPDGSPLPEGTVHNKINKQDLAGMFNNERIKKLPKPFIYSNEGGIHPDIIADLFGYENTQQMIEDIETAESRQAKIKRLTDQEMQKKHPNLLKSPEITQEAHIAYHNKNRPKLLRMELKALFESIKGQKVIKGVLKNIARRIPTTARVNESAVLNIDKRPIGEIRPNVYMNNAIKQSKETGKKASKGDFDGAFKNKLQEVFSDALYRVSSFAIRDIKKRKSKYKKILRSNKKKSVGRDMNYVEAARAMLAEAGLGKPEKSREALDLIKKYDPDFFESLTSLVDFDDIKPASLMTYEEFKGFDDAVQAMMAKSISEAEFTDANGKQSKYTEADAELADQLKKSVDQKKIKGFQNQGKISAFIQTVKAVGIRVGHFTNFVDFGKIGVFYKSVFGKVSEASNRASILKRDLFEKYKEILKPIEKTINTFKNYSNEFLIDDDGVVHIFKDKSSILGLLLHTGNRSNKEKLIVGKKWGLVDSNDNLDTSRLDAFIEKAIKDGAITKEDMDFVQSVWDLFDAQLPMLQKAHKRIKGYFFSEITAEKIDTPWGVYRGGYVPAKADPNFTNKAEEKAAENLFNDETYKENFPTAGLGSTKQRVKGYNVPLQMDINFIRGHIDWAVNFGMIEAEVREVHKLLRQPKTKAVFKELGGNIDRDVLLPWLKRSSTQRVSTSGMDPQLDGLYRHLRNNVGRARMAWNFVNASMQYLGLSLSSVRVKKVLLAQASLSLIKNNKIVTEEIKAKSNFMQNRVGHTVFEAMRAVDEIVSNPNALQKIDEFGSKHAYYLQQVAQGHVDKITWLGAYNQALESGALEIDAVREADSAVRDTQGSFRAEDVAKYTVTTPFIRLMLMFQDYFNNQANLIGFEHAKIKRYKRLNPDANVMGQYASLYMASLLVPAIGAQLLLDLSDGDVDDDDDKKYIDDVSSSIFYGIATNAASLVPAFGPYIVPLINQFTKTPVDDDISVSPVAGAADTSFRTVSQLLKLVDGDKKTNPNAKVVIKGVLEAVSLGTGLPVTALARPAGFAADIITKKGKITGPVDLVRGAITGKATKIKKSKRK